MSNKKIVLPSNMLGKNLRLLRKSKQLSMQKLAEKIGSSTGYISDVENGKAVPGGNFLYSIKRVFNIDIDSLFQNKNEGSSLVADKKLSTYYRKTQDEAGSFHDQSLLDKERIISEKSEKIRLLEKQLEELREDKKDLRAGIQELKEDKQRLLGKNESLKRELAVLEKGKNSA